LDCVVDALEFREGRNARYGHDLILDGYEISIHCPAYPCTNRVKADLDRSRPQARPRLGMVRQAMANSTESLRDPSFG
jgi:hypothetical protein